MSEGQKANRPVEASDQDNIEIPNGLAAAALLAAGFGCFALGLCAWVGDAVPSLKPFFTLYKPTGPLSGVTTAGIFAWLLLWAILARAWGGKTVSIRKTNTIAFVLLGLAFLLTYPPFGDFLQGK